MTIHRKQHIAGTNTALIRRPAFQYARNQRAFLLRFQF